MKIPRKPLASPDSIEAFISGSKVEGQNAEQSALQSVAHAEKPVPAQEAPVTVKVRRKPIRMKEEVLRQTFIISERLIFKLEAHAFWSRMTKKAVLEAALEQFFADKKIKAIPRQ